MAYFIAHKREDGAEQSVFEHLKGTAGLAREFGEAFGAGELAEQAGLYHDVGKYSEEFQAYIRGKFAGRVDHSTAGAQLLYEKSSANGLLGICVAGHHTGLLDFGEEGDWKDQPTFEARMKRHVPDYQTYRNELLPPKADPVIPPRLDFAEDFEIVAFCRMLFSCLVDADFLDTERFMQQEGRAHDWDDISVLAERFFHTLEGKGFLSPKGELNIKRTQILKRAMAAGQTKEGGIFSLTVPTGGGKTITATAFALEKCKALDLRRIIYVIPYTAIIEQTADVLRGLLNAPDGVDNVLEHHSAANYDDDESATEEERKRLEQLKLATENWDAPVVVTTNVQFFESLFAARTSKCRKLHNIAKSLIIFDEAQMFPIKFLDIFLRMIAELSQNYGATCLLMSATQPPWQVEFAKINSHISEMMEDVGGLHEFFRRVTYEKCGLMSPEELAERMRGENQAVLIALTKKGAARIYEALGEGDGNFYLSTNLCPAHRRRVIAQIKARLKENMPCRVVSTSVISVGVDLDFPVGYVEQAGLDSIIQAAGRVNREGRLSKDGAKVYVFKLPKESENSRDLFLKQERAAAEVVEKLAADLSSPENVQRYFKMLYEAKDTDKKDVMHSIETMSFREVAEKVKLIEEDTVNIFVPFLPENCSAEEADKVAEIVYKLNHDVRTRSLLRQAAPYMVSVRKSDYDNLLAVGAVKSLDSELAILVEPSRYDSVQGLLLAQKGGEAIFC